MQDKSFAKKVNPSANSVESLRPGGSRLTLCFDRLSVLSLSMEAVLSVPALKGGTGSVERVYPL